MLPDRCDVCGQHDRPIMFSVRAIVAGDHGPEVVSSALVCSGSCALIGMSDPAQWFTPVTAAAAEPAQEEAPSADPAA